MPCTVARHSYEQRGNLEASSKNWCSDKVFGVSHSKETNHSFVTESEKLCTMDPDSNLV